LADKVILITGAASGIGAAIARQCIAERAFVVCADMAEASAASLARELGDRAMAVTCDVTDPASADRAVARTAERFRRLDGLVHNAAAPAADADVVDLDPAHWHLELDVSLTGAFLIGKSAIPLMARSGGGSVVLMASQFGRVATARSVAYCAAKAGVIHLAKAMAVDHAHQSIRVNSLSPGAVATSRLLSRWPDLDTANRQLGPAHLLERIAQPAEVASAAAFLLSDDSSFVTGSDLLADGGYSTR
jgi:NAD(P)-dependent dehydrogenase (short-subunit alcohol dehydrogenase family)